jgi:hypothetical protein
VCVCERERERERERESKSEPFQSGDLSFSAGKHNQKLMKQGRDFSTHSPI